MNILNALAFLIITIIIGEISEAQWISWFGAAAVFGAVYLELLKKDHSNS